MSDLPPIWGLVDDLVRAVNDPGSHPEFHYDVMERHKAEWPTLWDAIEALCKAAP